MIFSSISKKEFNRKSVYHYSVYCYIVLYHHIFGFSFFVFGITLHNSINFAQYFLQIVYDMKNNQCKKHNDDCKKWQNESCFRRN